MRRKWIAGIIVCLVMLLAGAETAFADESYAETPLAGASEGQRSNILLAAQAIDGTWLGFGEGFSFNQTVGERSEEYGFQSAANGRGVSVVGGGVAQTATTLYLALMQRDDIEYSSIYTYNENFTGGYVDSGYDAIATDYDDGLDFAFNSYYEGELVIYMWIDGEALCCYVTEETPEWQMRTDEPDGYAETPVYAGEEQENNIRLAAGSINGWTMEPGDEFSFNGIVGPRSAQFGYRDAMNGRGVKVTGGGVAQAATVYLAVRDMDNVQIIEKQAYGNKFTGDYVEDGEDAVLVDYGGNIDFSFAYLGDEQLTIYIYIEEGRLICEVYED